MGTLAIMGLLLAACAGKPAHYKIETVNLDGWTLAYITPAEGTSIEPIGVDVKNVAGTALITPINGQGIVKLHPTNTKPNMIRLVRAGTDTCPDWVIGYVPFDRCEVIEKPIQGEKIP